MDNERRAAYLILKDVDGNAAFSNLAVNAVLEKEEVSNPAFVRELVYGVLRNAFLLDYNIQPFLKNPHLKTSLKVILRMGIYQICFMNSVPEHAAVAESVELAKQFAKDSSGFVNAVLRNFLRENKGKLSCPAEEDEKEYLSIKYSCHESIIGLWLKAYGRERTESMLSASLKAPELNTRTALFTGEPVIQGFASMRAVETLAPLPGEILIDMCAAPGGKTCYAGELMRNIGKIYAFDVYEKRVGLIDKQAERLNISIIETAVKDGTIPDPDFFDMADCVLADVPCSGLGTIAKKPEIKLKGLSSDMASLYAAQALILANGAKYVKPGGRLLYSTCTVNPRENINQVKEFLENNPDFVLVSEEQLFLDEYGTDGFYISLFRRNNA